VHARDGGRSPRRPTAGDTAEPGHAAPLGQLQREAGNRAVAGRAAVQRKAGWSDESTDGALRAYLGLTDAELAHRVAAGGHGHDLRDRGVL
jgi:hypothetical protein